MIAKFLWAIIHLYALAWSCLFVVHLLSNPGKPPTVEVSPAHTMDTGAFFFMLTWQVSIILTAVRALFGIAKPKG